MNTIKEIARELQSSDKLLFFPHMNMDGDALGSCAALVHGLRSMGKEAQVVICEDIPDNLRFLDNDLCLMVNPKAEGKTPGSNKEVEAYTEDEAGYTSVLVDCGELKRIKGREDIFTSGIKTICVDHHQTTEESCEFNYIDPMAAATGEIVYAILLEMGFSKDYENKAVLANMADALYAAITTDTGNFRYSNAKKSSHEIVADLYDWGLNHNKVSIEIYENNRIERLRLESAIMSNTCIFGKGKAAITYVTPEMLKETGGYMNETEGIMEMLRGIRGVEVAIFLKVEEENLVRCGLRSKEWFDVAELAASYDGGGHKRASGFTFHTNLEEATCRIKDAVEERLEKAEL